jgi:hypothetical protein
VVVATSDADAVDEVPVELVLPGLVVVTLIVIVKDPGLDAKLATKARKFILIGVVTNDRGGSNAISVERNLVGAAPNSAEDDTSVGDEAVAPIAAATARSARAAARSSLRNTLALTPC